ncbi:MAG: exodeoxyribonuclease VII large subunit, partial [Planctomycetia bacterium]|nr:exodeoxyribonuclease VII large subunit [Planctomycetia bacterium]
VPVVSAVGHETDFAISDFVADVRAPTPSVAAELVVPDAGEILRRIGAAQAALVNYITAQVDRAAGRLALVMQERYFRYPLELVTSRAQTIDDISDRMAATTGALVSGARLEVERLTARLAELAPRVQYERRVAALAMARHRLGAATATSTLARRRERVFHLADRLDDLGPMKVLHRGYSITKILRDGVEGRALVRAGDVRPGDSIRTRLAEGEIDSRVAGAEEQTFFDE